MLRTLTLLTVTCGALTLLACGPGYKSFDEIEEHLDNPTAPVTGPTVKAAFEANQEQSSGSVGSASGQLGFVPSFAWGQTAGGQTLYVPARLRPFLPAVMPVGLAAALGDGCENPTGLGASDAEMEINMSTVSGGEVTGTLKYEVSYDDLCNWEATITLDKICTTADDVCVDGAFGFKFEAESMVPMVGKMISSGNVTASGGGDELTLEWGLRVTWDEVAVSASVEFLAFVDYDGEQASLVIEAEAVAGSGSVTVRGSDGEFSCTYTSDGAEGSCTGPSGTVSWTSAT